MVTTKHKTTISEYLDSDYLGYAKYVVEHRAIPSMIDGLKPTQRKVIYIADQVWKSGKEKPYKVFQLTGLIAARTYYHHGDSSLNSSIIKMAQRFKNSMPLLEDIGQFGSLRSPEAGAPRYVSTKLHPNFRLLYKDFELVTPKIEEGDQIEPEYFLPIIPTVLLNGSSGIAVGFATNILNRNPLDLIECCLKELEGKSYKEPQPWFRGFTGTVEPNASNENSWIFKGTYNIKNTTTIEISELPPSMTFEKYDAYLDKLESDRLITTYEDNCKGNVNYVIKMSRTDLASKQERGLLDKFLKVQEIQTENLTVLDEFGKLKEFSKVVDIIKHFVTFRLTYYDKRKQYIINTLNRELSILSNKARFIKMIIDGILKINNVPKATIVKFLEKEKFDTVDASYSYLLLMPIYSLTKEKYEDILQQIKNKNQELDIVKGTKPVDMYKSDLLELKKAIKHEYT